MSDTCRLIGRRKVRASASLRSCFRSKAGIARSLILSCAFLLLFVGALPAQDSLKLDGSPRLEIETDLTDYIASFPSPSTTRTNASGKVVVVGKLATDFYPLLTTLFYERGDVNAPERYELFNTREQVRSFADTALRGGLFKRYRQLLNIIGFRMMIYPDTKVRIVGSYSKEAGESREIATERARIVVDYLMNIWHIDPLRIEISPVDEPYGRSSDTMLQAELRSVRIESDDWEIVKPLRVFEVRSSPLPLKVRVTPATEPNRIRSCRVEMFWKNALRRSHEFPWHPDSTAFTVLWNWKGEDSIDIPHMDGSVSFRVTIITDDGLKYLSDSLTLPIHVVDPYTPRYPSYVNLRVEHYTLLLFQRQKSEGGLLHDRIIGSYMSFSDYPTKARIRIVGHSDPGENDTKLTLSTARAKWVKKRLVERFARATNLRIEYECVGSTEPIYPSDLPEERCYNRTVEVVLEISREEP